MDDTRQPTSLPDDIHQLKALLAQRDEQLLQRDRQLVECHATITTLTQQRDEFYLKSLKLEVRLAKALKQAYGPRADRIADAAQMLLDFGQQLDALPIRRGDLPPEEGMPESAAAARRPVSRRIRTRGRRDIGAMDHLPMFEHPYELPGDLCRCPACQQMREQIGSEITYTIEHLPSAFVRIKHVQYKYACPHCEANGHHPQIELAPKINGSPIDKGLPGPGLLAYIATSKYADYRVQGEAVSEMRGGLSWPGDRTRPQTSPNCGGQELSWETSGAKGATRSRQVRSAKSNASEPLMMCRKRIQLTSKLGSGDCPRISMGRSLYLAHAASGIKTARAQIRLGHGTLEPVASMPREKPKRTSPRPVRLPGLRLQAAEGPQQS